jgi:hypothetical protein
MSERDGGDQELGDHSIAFMPSNSRTPLERVSFTKDELQNILNLYGRMVASGEWKDYAMDFLSEKAIFSVFRKASDVPLYRIEKTPKLAIKQGIFSISAASGLILRRGNDLTRVLNVLEKKLVLVKT